MFQAECEDESGSSTLTIRKPKRQSPQTRTSRMAGTIALDYSIGKFTDLIPMKHKGVVVPNRWGFKGLKWTNFPPYCGFGEDPDEEEYWIMPTKVLDDNGNPFLYFRLQGGGGQEAGDMLAKKQISNGTEALTEDEESRLNMDDDDDDSIDEGLEGDEERGEERER